MTTGEHIEQFFDIQISKHITENYKDKQIFKKFDQQQITRIIDFAPPFLRVEKIMIFDVDKDSLLQSRSLAKGTITTKDTAGHYNDTIFLAMCGWLMASAASIHLAILFPPQAPQVVEATGVKPILSSENQGIWKPSAEGTPFFVETSIVKKRLQLVIVKTNISFGKVLYGTIEELKLILTKKETFQSAKEIPLL